MAKTEVFMSYKRYPEEFKVEAVKQVTVAGYSVADVAQRLGTTTHSLYAWIKRYGPDSQDHQQKSNDTAEIRRLQKELKRVTEERDLLKKPRRTSQVTPSKIRLYCRTPRQPSGTTAMSALWCSPQWVLCLEASSKIETSDCR